MADIPVKMRRRRWGRWTCTAHFDGKRFRATASGYNAARSLVQQDISAHVHGKRAKKRKKRVVYDDMVYVRDAIR